MADETKPKKPAVPKRKPKPKPARPREARLQAAAEGQPAKPSGKTEAPAAAADQAKPVVQAAVSAPTAAELLGDDAAGKKNHQGQGR